MKRLRRLTTVCFLIVFEAVYLIAPSKVRAAGGLGGLSDVINNMATSAYAEHSIHFNLPFNAQQVNTTDYILVSLPGFSNVSAPTMLTGQYGGSPTFSAEGLIGRVTGVTITPGSTIGIEGLAANNPTIAGNYMVSVVIATDYEGTNVKNSGVVVATTTQGSVNLSATINTPQGRLAVSGYAAPNTFIIFTENSAVIGTDISNSLGYFAQIFPGLAVMTHNVSLYGTDSNNFTTSPIPITIYTPDQQQINITDLILSPTLQINATQVLQGDDLVASGSAMPDGALTIFTDNPLRTYYATAAADGSWDYTIDNTDAYIPGDYRIYALVQNGTGGQSLNSGAIGFSIITSAGSTGSACGNIDHGDLNCDTDINLTDFSILMYYWGTTNLAADINVDGIVNIIDFSILMYWWGT